MANIMVTQKCNLRCTYCFADEFVDGMKSCNEMSLENFDKALEFITRTENHCGIIGGEPLLKKDINQILDKIIENKSIQSCTIYTNGVNLDKVETQLIHPKFKLLINFNNDEILGTANKKRVMDSLDRLHNLYYKGDAISLGINMYKPDFEYDYIIELCKRYKKESVRTSVCVPNSKQHANLTSLEWFRLMKPSVMKFYRDAVTEGIVPYFDCNALPTCVLDKEEHEWVQKVAELARMNKIDTNIGEGICNCTPVIDILPDLSVVRCFGMSEDLKLNINDYDNLYDISSVMDNRIDCFKFLVTSSDECKTCKMHEVQKCTGGCLAYKATKINKAYSTVKSME